MLESLSNVTKMMVLTLLMVKVEWMVVLTARVDWLDVDEMSST